MGITIQQGAASSGGGGGGMTLIGTLTTTSGTTQSLTGIAAGYRKFYIEYEGVSFTTGATTLALALSSTNGAAYGAAANISAATGAGSDTVSGFVDVLGVSSAVTAGKIGLYSSKLNSGNYGSYTTAQLPTNTGAVVDALQFSGGTFDAGTIRIYGVK